MLFIRKTTLLIALTTSMLGCVPNGASQFQTPSSNRLIIKYKHASNLDKQEKMSLQDEAAIAKRAGVSLKHLRRLATGEQLMQLPKRLPGAALAKIKRALRTDPNVVYVEVDQMLDNQEIPNDAYFDWLWNFFEPDGGINVPNAWDISHGLDIVVAVIDSGYRPHADLVSNILPGYDMISDLLVSQDFDGRDNDAQDPGNWAPFGACDFESPYRNSSWHGTHVAGTIAAVTNNALGLAGVAHSAKVLPVRATGRCGGYTSDIAESIIWAAGGSVDGVPLNPHPAQVINLSLGGRGSCSLTTQAAIDSARSLGATIVVAAGNYNADTANYQPANCDGVIAVAATNRLGFDTYYTNHGSVVDISAPGGDMRSSRLNGIYSTSNSGLSLPENDTYTAKEGTSMAAPHVSGIVALMYAINANMNADTAETILKNTARPFTLACTSCGAGIVDAGAALMATPTTLPSKGLSNGMPATDLSAASEATLHYTLEVPPGAMDLNFAISGGTGNADLYVRYGAAPTLTSFDCRPAVAGNSEACNIAGAQAGTYHVILRATSSFAGVSLLAQYVDGRTVTGFTETNLFGSRLSWQYFTVDVAAGTASLDVQMSGGIGDADLYVRFGNQPSTSAFLCRPYKSGNNEICSFNFPSAGTWYIGIYGYTDYSGVTLEVK